MLNWNEIKADQLRRMREAFGELVEYRAGDKALRVRAIVGKTVTGTKLESNVVNVVHVRDFMVGVDELVDENGERIEPNRRHQVCRLELPGLPVFQVAEPEGAEDCFQFSDAGETQYRIHTKGIGSD